MGVSVKHTTVVIIVILGTFGLPNAMASGVTRALSQGDKA